MLPMTTREAHGKADVQKNWTNTDLGDLRFRNLLSKEDWTSLPLSIRRRFSKRLADGNTVVYVGEVIETRLNWAGRIWGQLARLIGGPLPTCADARVPSVVTVTEDMATGGQIWTRLYARRSGFPQVIQSSKQFSGLTGLEEYVGARIGMALRIDVEDETLLFRSAGYFVRIGHWRTALPKWLTPGALTVAHRENGDGRFIFSLDIVHPLFGTIVHQSAAFKEAIP